MQEQEQPGEHSEYNPWHDAETRYQPGQEVRGTVKRTTHFGVFVEVEPGLAGVIYTFELLQYPQRMILSEKGGTSVRSSDGPAPLILANGSNFLNTALGSSPAAVAGFVPGQELHAYVKSIDAGRKRLELSLRQSSPMGILEERALPTELRRGKALDELPWPMQHPPMSSPLPDVSTERSERVCPTCQRPAQSAWKYCVYCGGSLRRHCPLCGTVQPDLPDALYCCECGKIFS